MVALGMVVCILTLILCNMSYYELFISTSKLHKIRNSKNLNDVTHHIRGVDDAAEEGGKHVFNWPTKKKKKYSHTHPTLLYYSADGTIKPVRHGHRKTPYSQTEYNGSSDNNSIVLSSKVNNASLEKRKGKKNKKNNIAVNYHYSMPLPLDESNNIIDITDGITHLSPALWSTVDDSEAEGYLYPYNSSNNFIKTSIDANNPYGEQVTNKLKYENPTAIKYFNGIKHTHERGHKEGTAKGAWHLEKRAKKSVDKNVTKDMCVYESVDSTKYTVVRDGKKDRDNLINNGTTERTLTTARSLVNDENWSYCTKDDENSTDTSCVCLPGSCSYNSYGGAGGRPLNACIYQGTCSGTPSDGGDCSSYSDTVGTTGNKGSCEGAGCTWNYTNDDCSTYEDTYTNQDTCTSYNTGSYETDQGAAENACSSNPWCYWGN